MTENGRRRRITKLEAAVKQLVNRAASGEGRAMQLLLALVQASEARPPQPDANGLKPTELADYSVCTTWGVKGPRFYLRNVLRKKLAYPDLKRAVHEQHQLFDPSVILIEDKASGTQLIQELIEAGLSKVMRYNPDGALPS